MKKLIYYRPRLINNPESTNLPGMKNFLYFFKIYNHDVVIVDRTETIKLPIHTHNLFPIPKFRVFTKPYEDICNDRAKEILNKADLEGIRLYVLYSGGIDSTLIVVSLLKNATEKQKKNITILLSEESIAENPKFYKNHIQGKLQVDASANFPYILGTNVLLITGENNDQIFGADVVGQLITIFGEEVIHQPYNRELFIKFFNTKVDNSKMNTFYVNLFEKLCANAPVKITTNFEFLWWINFSLKWQLVFTRILVFTSERNISKITPEYIKSRYETFYNTEDFQLWAMNNLDKKIKNTWESYKWICKDIIYEYTKDADYRDNKTKIGSLGKIMAGNSSYNFIDDLYLFYKKIDFEEIYNKDNDFI
jgi:hypothetical protein